MAELLQNIFSNAALEMNVVKCHRNLLLGVQYVSICLGYDLAPNTRQADKPSPERFWHSSMTPYVVIGEQEVNRETLGQI